MKMIKQYINSYKFYITVFLTVLCAITTLTSVGFGALNQSLNISGDIDYEKFDNSPTLYNVLKNEARIGTYAREFTGQHQDAVLGNGDKKIYEWRSSSETTANVILDKWNVLFAGFCWQMIRTTDTGGVKMIYNGVPSSGKCNNTGSAQQIGTSAFNSNNDSISDIGYMYNKRYITSVYGSDTSRVFTSYSMSNSASYYYGTNVTYSGGTYTLTGVTNDTWSNHYSSSSSSGFYVCRTSNTISCSKVYYIVYATIGWLYGFEMTDGHMLDYYNTNLVIGTSYTVNNGIYYLSNTTTISLLDWYDDYSSYLFNYTCGNSSSSCSVLQNITSPSSLSYDYLDTREEYLYSNSFTYNSSTGLYKLNTSDTVSIWDYPISSNIAQINTHHYTCLNLSGECSKIAYIYYISLPDGQDPRIFFLELKDGNNINDALNEMLYADNVNLNNSTIKTTIDTWYANNMTSYTSKLEDIVYCYLRDINTLAGFNPNGGSVRDKLFYKTNFSYYCPRETDRFSLTNSKARLTYPVGLFTYEETYYLGKYLRRTNNEYWIYDPDSFIETRSIGHPYASMTYVQSSGNYYDYYTDRQNGVRPAISVKPGTEYTSGDGSKNNPYIVN